MEKKNKLHISICSCLGSSHKAAGQLVVYFLLIYYVYRYINIDSPPKYGYQKTSLVPFMFFFSGYMGEMTLTAIR